MTPHLLEAAVLADIVQGAHGADAADVVGVVAAAHDAQVDELLLGQAQLCVYWLCGHVNVCVCVGGGA